MNQACSSMRYAIISDIHSNLEALTAVIDDIERRSAGTILCLGDIVGYGADPIECLRIVEKISDELIQGNHDEAAATGEGIEYFNEHAAQAARWTAERLSDEEKVKLAALPTHNKFAYYRLKIMRDSHQQIHP